MGLGHNGTGGIQMDWDFHCPSPMFYVRNSPESVVLQFFSGFVHNAKWQILKDTVKKKERKTKRQKQTNNKNNNTRRLCSQSENRKIIASRR